MTDMFIAAERLIRMDDATWHRHANPWSVLSRMIFLPVLALAVWSRVWVCGWSWAAVAGVVVWTRLNPRAFRPPARRDRWASRGVLGERVFLRRRAEVARHHRIAAVLWSAVSIAGALVMALGLWWLDPWWTVFGTALVMGPKIWFLDRMVWLYDDWLRSAGKELGDV